jgi:hypothetical protein
MEVQFGGRPLGDGNRDPAGFRAALGGRTLFLVSVSPGHAPGAPLDAADFARDDSRALHRLLRWKTPPTASALSIP